MSASCSSAKAVMTPALKSAGETLKTELPGVSTVVRCTADSALSFART